MTGLYAYVKGALEAGKERVKLKAYHGSPHSFDRFSTDSIGTGEGAQAYGHGLYFAQREGTAKSYKNELSTSIDYDGKPILRRNKQVGTTGDEDLDDSLIADLGDVDKSIQYFEKDLQSDSDALRDDAVIQIEKLKNAKSKVTTTSGGHMYEVDINASPDELLDYDLPLSQQSDAIQLAAIPIMEKIQKLSPDSKLDPDMSGGALYRMYSEYRGKNPEFASEGLKEVGIKGIKYADQQTRSSKGARTNNYVIFDDSLIDIARKYGISADVLSNTAIYGGTAALIGMGLSPSEAQASVKEANNPANTPLADRLTQKVDGQIQTIAPIKESYRGAATRNLAEALGGKREDYTRAKKLMSAGDFLPGIGEAQAGVDAVDAATRGDYLEAGVNALGILPLAGGVLAKGGKELIRASQDLRKGVLDEQASMNVITP